MKVLGNSLHIANSGKLIARGKQTPIAGALVFNSKKNKIGKVNTVFGPTKSPYISINLFRSTNRNQIINNYGEKLFVSTKRNKKRKSRR
ncbi:Gar1/Naf1 family protein [Methanobrevibacter wolinii]|uniref:Gar1/Naf1 family protein n=1 Tax=Methanobrevibacter wolinii TaxID=190977 RepID=UPI0005B2E25E|nr:Gar1/Naf1 family protein [Methanobrevibacter wolinii]MDD5959563.1 Gar1/Naf1 family protein [Methanobrevibacter wolinii]